jgi:hypothetical protein
MVLTLDSQILWLSDISLHVQQHHPSEASPVICKQGPHRTPRVWEPRAPSGVGAVRKDTTG